MYSHNRRTFNLSVNVTPHGSQLVWFLILRKGNTRLTQGPIDGNGQIDGSEPYNSGWIKVDQKRQLLTIQSKYA